MTSLTLFLVPILALLGQAAQPPEEFPDLSMPPGQKNALLGQAAQPPEGADDPAARLAYMKGILGRYELRSVDADPAEYRLKAEPVLRFSNTVGSSRDGAVFVWLGEHDRPVAAAQVAVRRGDGVWYHELSSLSEQPLQGQKRASVIWSPNRGGATFQPLAGAPQPAETPDKRMRQMSALAAEFSVEDNFRREGWQKLRMLPKPLARYGEPKTSVIDGALFAYVLTTDPEALLLIEARQAPAGAEWRYAFAPMTIFALRSFAKGTEVWNVPDRGSHGVSRKPTEPFHVTELPNTP